MAAFTKTRLAAANPAVANHFVTSTNMKVGAYTLANTTMPTTPGARRITVTHTTATGADTLGTITVTGTDLNGKAQVEVITPVASSTATGSKWFVTVSDVTGAGWVINGGNDTLTVGAAAGSAVLASDGMLYAIVVNTTAAGTIAVADGAGTFATLKSSIAEGSYYYQVACVGYLMLTLGAASDVTVIHSPTLPAY